LKDNLFDSLNNPKEAARERHYVMAHHAFRQIAEQDSHYFFSLMASQEREAFVANLIGQVENNCPDDTTVLRAQDFRVTPTRIANYPLVLIEMPVPEAYTEALFVAVVAMVDLTQTDATATPTIGYYTLELGEGEDGDCYFLCQWQDGNHLNLAEISSQCSATEFAMLVEQHLSLNNN